MFLTWTVLGAGVVAVLWYFATYNRLVNSRYAVDQSWSNIEVELKRRLDLIENLVQVVRGYASHEADTLINVTSLRTARESATSATDANSVEAGIKSSLGKIMAIVESYPQLRADGQFLNLQTELATTENRIAERRNGYNQSVSMYRNLLQMFPSSIVAGVQGFEERAFFDAPDEEINKVPEVKI